jgi:DNA-binding winged helix-turn-helix (wHTH) protein
MRPRSIPAPAALTAPMRQPEVATIEATQAVARFRFQDYVVDRLCWELHWRGVPLKLSRKGFDMLLYLVDHRDRVVSKGELLDELWAGRVVEEGNLSQQVFLIHKALAAHGSGTRIIDSVRGRGYRFVAEIEPLPRVGQPLSSPERWSDAHEPGSRYANT